MSWIVSGTNLDGSTKTCLLLVSNSSEYLAEQKKVVASSFWNVVIGDRVAFLKIERKHLWIYNDIYIYGYKNQKHQLKCARSHVLSLIPASISLPWDPGICGLHADHKYLGGFLMFLFTVLRKKGKAAARWSVWMARTWQMFFVVVTRIGGGEIEDEELDASVIFCGYS